MNCEKVVNNIKEFIKEKTSGFNGVVIGLSGGIDSALSAFLAVDALGKDKVFGIMLPNGNVMSENTLDAVELARHYLGINYIIINIEPSVDGFRCAVERRKGIDVFKENVLILGNVAARARMTILYAYAQYKNYLVLGTTNKTEVELGYYTKYGDGAVDLEPIADLYKCEVIELSKYLGVPDFIINKAPTAELWQGQTDEDEIGCTYDELDKYLMGNGGSPKVRDIVTRLNEVSAHKRVMPPHCKLRSIII